MNKELQNCPFCGNKPRIIRASKIKKQPNHFIFCDKCTMCYNQAMSQPIESLIEEWNKRQEGPEIEERYYKNRGN